ncbi:MAG TPA: hypothetical protein VKS20_05025 [Candidatus Acidoferrales bacterium]|nr:hypothetical protein [Candidatus Acidoferrales bacterium]
MSESGYAIQPDAASGQLTPHAAPASAISGADVLLPRAAAKAKPHASRLLWLVSFPAMLGAFLVARVFASMRAFFVDPDLWWHIKNGADILATHHWPTTDPYSFTVAGQPWMSCEWLGDVLLAAVSRIGGVLGLDILLIVLGSAVMIALYYLGTLRSGNSKAGFLAAGLVCSLAFVSFTLRPQMLGYLFLVLTMIALEFFRQGKHRAIWFLPPLMLVWINTHGSWIIGLGAIFAYWICGLKQFQLGGIEGKAWTSSERRQISFIFMLCLAVLPITPYGTRLAAYPFHVASSLPLSLTYVTEWWPMPFNTSGGKLFLAILLGFLVLQIVYRFSWRLEELALFLFATTITCIHMRFVLVFVPFFVPLLATTFARWLPLYDRRKEHYALNAVLIAAVIAGMLWFRPTQTSIQDRIEARFPVGAVNYIRQHSVPEPMFNAYNFGGYLVWSLDPGRQVYVDGRSELYEAGGVLGDYIHIANLSPGALKLLADYHVKSCLMEHDAPLATVLAALPEWKKVYSDGTSVLFVRQDSSTVSNLPSAERK